VRRRAVVGSGQQPKFLKRRRRRHSRISGGYDNRYNITWYLATQTDSRSQGGIRSASTRVPTRT
jgi:hypothetical protein